ncbi:uncharacterized protein LOC112194693 [Rosa chinensis]|uniref:uncharacterized protein LOC112194693 n=1 Tax=Rosa chinensis TaxID=74649 RepID=UPI000D08E2D9|nr:uncharacterized protein LOC112194693 [Rosa chinensis]
MGFRGQCSDEGGETEEDLGSLQGSEIEEDEEGNPLQIPTWRGIKLKSWNRRVDLKNPKFVLGHVFANNEVRDVTVAKEVQADLLVDEDWSRKGIQNHIQKKFNLDVSVQKVSRGKNKAKRMNEGHYIDQYNKLASYKKELLRSNPGSTVVIKTEMVGKVRRFHRMYVCLAACKKGWIEGCRPIIGLDGCHIKGHHPEQLLCAIRVDGNNGMFPIAYAIAEVENTDTLRWFLEYPKWDLRIERESAYTFITDKQKGLGIAIGELLPLAEHRHCVRHMYNNFKAKHLGEGLKQLVWDAARSSTKV